ncbi:MAG TPA: AMP-binding protein [Chitinophaga sp.]|uniref:AMP-binding protein n=1 Tax=Chitinophaga sp. TaxID=1869181 RepID=UPI002DBA8BDC|nr:AMP-binding protein [Chitinophaga sp.]HEU4552189.1 AMP-binding protein [Chitinophaga sp.]
MYKEAFFSPFKEHQHSVIVDATQSKNYTYREVYDQVSGIAADIEKLRIARHTIIVIYGYKNAFKSLQLFFSCLKCDLIPFIVEAGNLSKITDLKFSGIFSEAPLADSLVEKADVQVIQDAYLYYNIHDDVYVGDENDLLIVSSSGTTAGTPKKILLGKKQTIANIQSNREALAITKEDATLILLPVSYSYGLIAQFLTHFFTGARIVLGERLLGVLQLPQLFQRHQVTNVFMTPLLARLILYYYQKIPKIKNNLRFITLGGDKPHPPTFQKTFKLFNCPIYSTYGLAEAGPRVATNKYAEAPLPGRELCIGSVNPGITIKLAASEKYQEKYSDTPIGYLQISSPSIYLGYIKGNELHKPPSDTVLTTKDICIKKENRVFVLGREGDFIEYKDRIIWFNSLSDELYHAPEILKVSIRKDKDDKLEIGIFHRNKITVPDIQQVLKDKYDLHEGDNYYLKLIEFNNTYYK